MSRPVTPFHPSTPGSQMYERRIAPALSHPSVSGYHTLDGRGTYDDYSRYPYGDPVRGDYDAPYAGGAYTEPGYYGHSSSSVSPYYNDAASMYDDGRSYYDDMEYPSSNALMRRRRSLSIGHPAMASSLSVASHMGMGPLTHPSVPLSVGGAYDPYASSAYSSYQPNHMSLGFGAGHGAIIKFRCKGAFRSGITLADAVAGMRLSGSEYLKWYEMTPDARGRVYLTVRWNGYSSLTYEIPVDSYDGRVRITTLARRIARACIHFIQASGIGVPPELVKMYNIEEIRPGTWQPMLTVM